MSAAIEARDVRFKVPDGPDVLAGIDLTINDGEFVVIVGPSGCGKTTFLNMVAGLQGFTSGHLRVAGAAAAGRAARDGLCARARCAAAVARRARQCRARAADPRRCAGRAAPPRWAGARARRARRRGDAASGAALARHAPARRARAHLRDRAAPADPRRAVRGARRADPHPHAGAAARAAAAVLRHHDHGDARHRRGDHPGRPRGGVQPASRDRDGESTR